MEECNSASFRWKERVSAGSGVSMDTFKRPVHHDGVSLSLADVRIVRLMGSLVLRMCMDGELQTEER